MNIEEVVNEIAELFDKARPADGSGYRLVVNAGKLKLRKAREFMPGDVNVTIFTSHEITYGLTPARWDRVGRWACEILAELVKA
jgi:hypothetical protein